MEGPTVIPIDRNGKYVLEIPPESDIDPEGASVEISEWLNDDSRPFLIITDGVKLTKVENGKED